MNTIIAYRHRERIAPLLKMALWIGMVAIFLGLGFVAPTTEASVRNSTIPPLLTVLVGPVSAISETNWEVAGVDVQITEKTRINERIHPAQPTRWARVEGVPNGSGGLVAYRIKVLPPLPFVKIVGTLDTLEDDSLAVSGILVSRTDATLIVGPVTVGARVEVKARMDVQNRIALHVHPMGRPNDDDDDDDDDGEVPDANKVELIGLVIDPPTDGLVGPWQISTIVVSVTETTEVKQPVGAPILGAWVKVEGSATGDGGILAHEMKTIETRQFHKLEGVLDALSDAEITVSGIVIALDPSVKIEGTPNPGRRVEVHARLDAETQTLYAVRIEIDGDNNGDDGQRHHIGGHIRGLPEQGLVGEWQINNRKVTVTEATVIDEHKGMAEIGAVVRAEVLKTENGPWVALEIVVLRSEDDDDDEEEDNEYVEFEGAIDDLPDNGTLLGNWMVDGRRVAVSERTVIKGNPAQIVLHALVEVEGYERADGVIEARKIKPIREDDGGGDDHMEFEGEIEELPRQGLIGIWRVAGRDVKVTPQTEIKGNVAVGVNVEVEGRQHQQGLVSAEKIEVLDDDDDDDDN